jgi:hypothetical protein
MIKQIKDIFFILFLSNIITINLSSSIPNNNIILSSDYQVQHLNLNKLYSNISFKIKITGSFEQNSIENHLNLIFDCFRIEIEDNSGLIPNNTENNSDILISIIISKYITNKISKEYFKTFIDIHYSIYNKVNNNLISQNIASISGNGDSPSKSNIIAIQKITKQVLLDTELIRFLTQIRESDDNRLSQVLNRLSDNLLKEFSTNSIDFNNPINIAFIGFKNDSNLMFTNNFISSLKAFWKEPKYHFYSRDNLDKIIEEYKLSLTGIFNNKSILKNIELKSVDYLIAGNVTDSKNEQLLEIQIINVQNGEIIAAKTAHY